MLHPFGLGITEAGYAPCGTYTVLRCADIAMHVNRLVGMFAEAFFPRYFRVESSSRGVN